MQFEFESITSASSTASDASSVSRPTAEGEFWGHWRDAHSLFEPFVSVLPLISPTGQDEASSPYTVVLRPPPYAHHEPETMEANKASIEATRKMEQLCRSIPNSLTDLRERPSISDGHLAEKTGCSPLYSWLYHADVFALLRLRAARCMRCPTMFPASSSPPHPVEPLSDGCQCSSTGCASCGEENLYGDVVTMVGFNYQAGFKIVFHRRFCSRCGCAVFYGSEREDSTACCARLVREAANRDFMGEGEAFESLTALIVNGYAFKPDTVE